MTCELIVLEGSTWLRISLGQELINGICGAQNDSHMNHAWRTAGSIIISPPYPVVAGKDSKFQSGTLKLTDISRSFLPKFWGLIGHILDHAAKSTPNLQAHKWNASSIVHGIYNSSDDLSLQGR